MRAFSTIKRKSIFSFTIKRGFQFISRSFIVRTLSRRDYHELSSYSFPKNNIIGDDTYHIGLIISKKVANNAVTRNYTKRRFRHLISNVFSHYDFPKDYFYIFIIRRNALNTEFKHIYNELVTSLKKICTKNYSSTKIRSNL